MEDEVDIDIMCDGDALHDEANEAIDKELEDYSIY